MTADRQYLSVDWGFTIVATDEVAHTGLNFSTVAPGYSAAAADLATIATADPGEALIGDMQAFIAGGAMNWAAYSRLNTVRISAVGTNGLEIPGADAYLAEHSAPPAGSVLDIPPQCTVVGSLRSGQTTGAANYGRMYFPHSRQTLGGVPWASTAHVTVLRDNFAAFLTAVTDEINAILPVTVLQPVIITHKSGAASKAVAEVGVGRLCDTQRRRRNRLTEETQLIAWPT